MSFVKELMENSAQRFKFDIERLNGVIKREELGIDHSKEVIRKCREDLDTIYEDYDELYRASLKLGINLEVKLFDGGTEQERSAESVDGSSTPDA